MQNLLDIFPFSSLFLMIYRLVYFSRVVHSLPPPLCSISTSSSTSYAIYFQVWRLLYLFLLFAMESVNKVITLHKPIDSKKNLLLNHHYEIYDPILSCINQEKIPIFCLSQLDENFQKFKVWESGLLLCVVPQVFHFPEIIKWCVSHYSNETRSVVT